MKKIIERKLIDELNPEFIEVINNSYLHKGHLENNQNGDTHFAIKIKSEELSKLSKIFAHRKINKILQQEFANGLHALEIKIMN